jgi:hypothetical protein
LLAGSRRLSGDAPTLAGGVVAKGLGKLLKRKEGQIIDGLRLELRADRKAKINRYGVANLQEPDFR